MIFILSALLLLASLSAFGQSQEAITEKMLSFLPQDSYEIIKFERSEFSNPSSDFSINSFSLNPVPGDLPASFVDLWSSRCTVTRINVVLEEVTDQKEIDSLSLLGDPLIIDDLVYKVTQSEDELRIYYFDLIEDILEEALRQQQMKPLKTDNDDKIFTFIDGGGNESFIAVVEGYVLLAPDVIQLENMLSAGRGGLYSFYFQEEGRQLLRIIHELEGNWRFWSSLPYWRSLLSQVAELDSNNSLKYIAAGELERGCIFIITNSQSAREQEKTKSFFIAKTRFPSLRLRNLEIVQTDGYETDELATGLGPKHPERKSKSDNENLLILYQKR